ncbi:MAG: hypothetical protein KDD53_09745, partial [Bdellovibrionales bacterium]|nr:hypothetical protein [Bdellovibrionales bacterium]
MKYTDINKRLSLRHSKLIGVLITLTACTLVSLDFAYSLDVTYEFQGYGSKHVLLNLTGKISNRLSVTPGTGGKSVRISGVDVQFQTTEKQSKLPLISSVRQVRRGTYTDLIVNLLVESDVSASATGEKLQVLIKPRQEYTNTGNNDSSSNTESIPAVFDEKPVQIMLPDPDKIDSPVPLSTSLRWTAYLLDASWSWITGIPVEADPAIRKDGD